MLASSERVVGKDFQPLDTAGHQCFPGTFDDFGGIVETWDDRLANQHVLAAQTERFQVLNNQFIRNIRILLMGGRNRVLEVVQEQVGEGGGGKENVGVHEAGGVERRMQAAFLAPPEDIDGKVRLGQRFSAGEGNATAGFLVEDEVAGQLVGNRLRVRDPSRHFQRLLGTGIDTQSAMGAYLPNLHGIPARSDGVFWANRNAGATSGTPVLRVEKFRLVKNTLGIVAPAAVQRTTFQESRCTYPRPVVERKPLDVEYYALYLLCFAGLHGISYLVINGFVGQGKYVMFGADHGASIRKPIKMKVVLKHAGRWLHFSQPKKVLRTELIEEVLPMVREAEESGLFAAGFVSYEAAPAFDSALKTLPSEGFPVLCLGLFHAPEVLEEIEEAPTASFDVGELIPSVSENDFVEAIGEIKERIAEGATYQVNYTYRLNGTFSGDAWAFFHELVKGQKTEYAAYVEAEDFSICSASPELFFSFNEGRIVSRPMKGTARRGRTFSEDWKQAEMLRNSEKDRAENIMIVDMIRNDIGRIAEPGSVETVSKYDVEKYPTVWQMTSTVQGVVDATPSSRHNASGEREEGGASTFTDLFRALFPCASITGAPKAKTMEIITGLETTPRKIYTGSMGFITPQGEACFNVAIRTALIDREAGTLEYGVGGGIVWDSDAEAEYEETLTKARVLTQPRPEFQLLETMLWEPGSGIFLLNEHMQRLGKSAAYFDVPLDVYAIQEELDRVVSEFDESPRRLRLLVSRDGMCEVQSFPVAPRTAGTAVPTLKIALSKEPIDPQDVFLCHKTTHRDVYEKAKADFPDCDEVILWNERGEVTEGCIANVVVRKNGKLITPPIECGLLAGTFREHLLKNGEIEEGIVSIEDLRSASEVFLVNSVRKWQKSVWTDEEEKA